MKKTITIVCDKDVPVRHLLNEARYEIYETVGNGELFTLVEKDERLKES